ncbi:hypothetical protein BRADI_1g06451v3 [Brachypodium distachyon]|uniref:Uncharacterized protein n=1 Tax=Brachypodium distachyon TaxID=15368 RepID=A0A0Q3N867_BRADI|nr:hypothetical protein BRADI_1g06451v3 [Brachypodium distachyon]
MLPPQHNTRHGPKTHTQPNNRYPHERSTPRTTTNLNKSSRITRTEPLNFLFTPKPAGSLLDAVLLLEHADELIHLLRRVEALGDALPLAAPLRPRRQLRRNLLQGELPELLIAMEPRRERREGGIHEPEPVFPTEKLLLPELRLQGPQNLLHLLPRLHLGFPLELPEPGAAVVDLLVDVVGPEPGLRARVRVGGGVGGKKLAGVGEGFVEVLDDDEGLVDGAAVVEEAGDLLVDRRDPDPLPERAHPEVQQRQALLLARHCRIFSFSVDFDCVLCVCSFVRVVKCVRMKAEGLGIYRGEERGGLVCVSFQNTLVL